MQPDETAADRLRLALELHDFGTAMYRQRIRRDHPDWPADQVEAAVGEWLADSTLDPGRPASAARLRRLAAKQRLIAEGS